MEIHVNVTLKGHVATYGPHDGPVAEDEALVRMPCGDSRIVVLQEELEPGLHGGSTLADLDGWRDELWEQVEVEWKRERAAQEEDDGHRP